MVCSKAKGHDRTSLSHSQAEAEAAAAAATTKKSAKKQERADKVERERKREREQPVIESECENMSLYDNSTQNSRQQWWTLTSCVAAPTQTVNSISSSLTGHSDDNRRKSAGSSDRSKKNFETSTHIDCRRCATVLSRHDTSLAAFFSFTVGLSVQGKERRHSRVKRIEPRLNYDPPFHLILSQQQI